MKVDSRDVESAAYIEPVGWADHALIAKEHRLAPRQDIRKTSCGIADLDIPFPEGPRVLVRIAARHLVIEKDASILQFTVEA
jgi:hypothetical protein